MDDTEFPASSEHGTRLAFWAIPSFDLHERTKAWYWTAGVIGIGFLIFSYFDKNYLFPIIILIIAAILFQRSRRQPESIGFSIYHDGVELLGQDFHPYRSMKNFWIVYQPPEAKFLYFRMSSGVHGILRVPLQDENPLEIREILTQYLPEDLEREIEPPLDALGRKLKL